MTKYNVLFLENLNNSIQLLFNPSIYNLEFISYSLDDSELIEKIRDVHIIGIRSKTQLSETILKHAKNLLIIGCFCIGTNQVDLNYCKSHNIAVFNSPFMNTRSVSELVICLIIGLSRKLGDQNCNMHRGIWKKSSTSCYEIRGKTLGIIGYGHVGSQVSVLAESIGMNVVYYDIAPKMSIGNSKPMNTLYELLQQSDYVTLHVPLKEDTINLINTHRLLQMKPNSYLLNLSRGNVIDIKEVCRFLKDEYLAGLAIDVYPNEPKSNIDDWECCLQGVPNVIMTPHIGGSTEEAQYFIGQDVSNKILSFINNGNTDGCLTFPNILVNKTKNCIRITNIHKNIPGIIYKVNEVLKNYNCNIKNQYLATNNEFGYCIVDINKSDHINIEKLVDELNKIENILKIYVL